MNTYSSLRKQNNNRGLAVISLALCVVMTATMLFSRLLAFTVADTQHYIPLTEGNGITTVRVGQRQADGSVVYEHMGYHPANHRLLTGAPGFKAYDDNTVWEAETDVEIFRISYENGSGQVTVNSNNGEKVLAPGTANEYRFTLENSGMAALDYELTMEAYFSDDALPIPVVARVTDYKGNYLAGSAEGKVDVLELNNVKQSGALTAGYVAPYTLEWEWPFEGDDGYDTMLGNLAVDQDITLTIVIKTVATYCPNPDIIEGNPKTGDTGNIQLAFTMMMASGAGLLVILLLPKRKREEENE